MVYQGPSKACARCKQRHIKCDETRPECRNCLKRQLPCPGYAPEPGIRFQDETTSTIHQAQQRERRHTRRTSTQDTVVPRAIPQDAEAVAVNFFFDNYAALGRGSESSHGFFENIVPIYSSTTPTSAMSAATSAVALTLMSEWHGRSNQIPLARKNFGNALSLLRSSLNDPVLSLTDDTMMAVLLLKFHDMLGARKKLQKVPEDHVNGAIALIKHRGLASFTTDSSKGMLQYVRHTAINSGIQRRTPIVADAEIWIDPGSMLNNPVIELDTIALYVANLRASSEVCSMLLYSPATSPVFDEKQRHEFRSVRSQAQDLNLRLTTWANQRRGRWRPSRVPNKANIHPTIITAGFNDKICDLYPSPQVANVWNLHRSYQLILLEILIHCEKLLNPTWTAPSAYATMFRDLVDDICASVPFLLGNRTEPGSIDEFEPPFSCRYPEHPDDGTENDESLEMDMFMTQEQRTKSLLAQGPWQLYDLLSQVIRFVNSRASESLNSIIGQEQTLWIQEQMERVMRIQRIPPLRSSKSPEAKAESSSSKETLKSFPGEDEGEQEALDFQPTRPVVTRLIPRIDTFARSKRLQRLRYTHKKK